MAAKKLRPLARRMVSAAWQNLQRKCELYKFASDILRYRHNVMADTDGRLPPCHHGTDMFGHTILIVVGTDASCAQKFSSCTERDIMYCLLDFFFP